MRSPPSTGSADNSDAIRILADTVATAIHQLAAKYEVLLQVQAGMQRVERDMLLHRSENREATAQVERALASLKAALADLRTTMNDFSKLKDAVESLQIAVSAEKGLAATARTTLDEVLRMGQWRALLKQPLTIALAIFFVLACLWGAYQTFQALAEHLPALPRR